MTYTATTPTYTLTFEGVDLTTAVEVAVTITDAHRNVLMELTDTDLTIEQTLDAQQQVTGCTVSFTLTQAQTIAFPQGNLYLQVNWKPSASTRACSDIVSIAFRTNLKNEVM